MTDSVANAHQRAIIDAITTNYGSALTQPIEAASRDLTGYDFPDGRQPLLREQCMQFAEKLDAEDAAAVVIYLTDGGISRLTISAKVDRIERTLRVQMALTDNSAPKVKQRWDEAAYSNDWITVPCGLWFPRRPRPKQWWQVWKA